MAEAPSGDIFGSIDWKAGGAGALGSLPQLYSLFGTRPRRNRREAMRMQKARAKYGVEDLQAALETHKEETERERAFLKQSLFGRGMGKSSIATQEMSRQERLALRREAAMRRQLALAERGLALVRSRAKHEKRMEQMEMISGIAKIGAGFFV